MARDFDVAAGCIALAIILVIKLLVWGGIIGIGALIVKAVFF